MQYRFGGSLAKLMAKRIGLKKHGDSIAIFFTLEGEPSLARPITLGFDRPFCASIGFCSHLPGKSESCRQRHNLPLRDGCNSACRAILNICERRMTSMQIHGNNE